MKRVFHILIIISFFLSVTYSQDLLEKTLNGSLEKAELKANDKVVSIFDVSKTFKTEDYSDELRRAIFLTIDNKAIGQIMKSNNPEVILSVPVSEDKSFKLRLHQVEILAPDYHMETSDGRIKYPDLSKMKFYRGTIEDDLNSFASVTIINGQLRALLSDSGGDYIIGRLPNMKDHYGLYNESQLKIQREFNCYSDGLKIASNSDLNRVLRENKSTISPCVPIYVEADYQTYLDHNQNENDVQEFIMDLIAEVATLYSNNTGSGGSAASISISLSSTYVWTSADPYRSEANLSQILEDFGFNRKDTPDGRLKHLISTRNLGGGVAWIDVLCADYFTFVADFTDDNINNPITHYAGPYAVSYGMNPGIVSVPTYSWNVEVFAHEMGHNMGSPHTHACSWTGGAIDNCWYTEGGCSYGPDPGASGGTIMSYCHLGVSSGAPNTPNPGINLSNGFGPIPGQHIYDIYMDAADDDRQNNFYDLYCLLECASPDIDGCTNPTAHNYDENATVDDGSCETCSDMVQNGDETNVDCGGSNPNCPACVSGCTDIAACNYDQSANVNMGCEYSSCAGCTDISACNYDNSATIDDGSCEFLTCAGCTEVFATNYDPTKTINNGSCVYDCDASSTTDITDSNANSTIISGANTMSTDDMSPVDVDMNGPFYWRARQSIEINGGFTIQAGSSLTIDVGDCEN